MVKNIWITRCGIHQSRDEEANQQFTFAELAQYLMSDQSVIEEKELSHLESVYPNVEDRVSYLKKERYPNIIQGAGKSLDEASDHWNQLYFLDYDIKDWTTGIQGMKDCIQKLAEQFPNHFLVMPSNRFGIHLVLATDSQSYNPAEHLYYAITAYRIIKMFNPVFKKDDLHEQVMDPSFFNNFNQRMNLNLYTFCQNHMYRTKDFIAVNPSPIPYPFPHRICSFDNYRQNVTDEEKKVISWYEKKLYGSKKKEILTSCIQTNISTVSGNRFDINRNFSIPGVEHTGNALRWRIVAILYKEVGYEDAKRVITSSFVQVGEMLAALETVCRNPSGMYMSSNYLIEQFVKRCVLYWNQSTTPITLSPGQYLSDHKQTIMWHLQQGSIYLNSSSNSGKTELIKNLIRELEKCIIIVPQKSILYSKFGNDPELAEYIIETRQIGNIDTLPNKVICIWDTFAKLSANRNLSDYYVLLDETHNFIAQLSFRGVIFDVLESLKNIPHQLWMTGTPLGEEKLMGTHIPLTFVKPAETKYIIHPIYLDTNSKKAYLKYMEAFLDDKLSKERMVFVYDNYDHQEWGAFLEQKAARYASVYRDTDDVKEINTECQTSKDAVISTCYLGEGVDIKGYEEVDVVIPTNRFVSEVNIRQFMKRFRDAETVNVYLIQYTNTTDNRMPYDRNDLIFYKQYLEGLADPFNERNPLHDEALMIDRMTREDVVRIATDKRYQQLYDTFFRYMSTPFNIYMSYLLRLSADVVIVNDIKTVPVSEDGVKPSQAKTPVLLEYINKFYMGLAHRVKDESSYDEVIKEVEYYVNSSVPLDRREIRMLLEIIHAADELGCLKDCGLYFRHQDGSINWGDIKKFCEHIHMKMDLLNRRITLTSSIFNCMLKGEREMDRIDKTCAKLNFKITDKPSFKEQVQNYKSRVQQGLSWEGKWLRMIDKGYDSIFKPKAVWLTLPKCKPVSIVCIATNETKSFRSEKECMSFLGITKPTFKSFVAGKSKLNKTWRVQ